mmetsp:Transcript_20144/g.41337  ORF Transcript_20144/g.41337 Transcript_20144/m.41337 type:complete len:221 (-) Transcript_20144:338-1000(-)
MERMFGGRYVQRTCRSSSVHNTRHSVRSRHWMSKKSMTPVRFLSSAVNTSRATPCSCAMALECDASTRLSKILATDRNTSISISPLTLLRCSDPVDLGIKSLPAFCCMSLVMVIKSAANAKLALASRAKSRSPSSSLSSLSPSALVLFAMRLSNSMLPLSSRRNSIICFLPSLLPSSSSSSSSSFSLFHPTPLKKLGFLVRRGAASTCSEGSRMNCSTRH